jgi:hypothetical protein
MELIIVRFEIVLMVSWRLLFSEMWDCDLAEDGGSILSFEMLINLFQTTLHHIPEDRTLQIN